MTNSPKFYPENILCYKVLCKTLQHTNDIFKPAEIPKVEHKTTLGIHITAFTAVVCTKLTTHLMKANGTEVLKNVKYIYFVNVLRSPIIQEMH